MSPPGLFNSRFPKAFRPLVGIQGAKPFGGVRGRAPAHPHRPGIREVRRKLSSVYSATRNQALLLSRNGSQAS